VRRWIALAATAAALSSCSISRTIQTEVSCQTQNRSREILMTQAVPSATLIPCVRTLPPGWSYAGSDVRSGSARFWLDSDRAGLRAVEVELTAACDLRGLTGAASPSGQGVDVYLRSISRDPYQADRLFAFPGGCVTYRYRFVAAPQVPRLVAEIDAALTFLDRSAFVAGVREGDDGATLCGAGAPACVGS
jgi:hypothetical protein